MPDREYYTGAQLRNYLIASLQDKWGLEADALSKYVLMEVLNVDMKKILMGTYIGLEDGQRNQIEDIISRLNRGEPVQYIFGHAYFLGRKFKVNSKVLIPRPETEELVLLAIKHQHRPDPRILDIGVGSGCIGISLALERNLSTFTGLDKDPYALEVAQENARVFGINMSALKIDVLKEHITVSGFDIIISNPPYVLPSERLHMRDHVLNHEPEEALFVPEENPLIFYRRIMEESVSILNPEGMLLFEINESFGQQVRDLMMQHRFTGVLLQQDIHGKDRFVLGIK